MLLKLCDIPNSKKHRVMVTFRKAQQYDFESIFSIWLDGITYTFADFVLSEKLKEEFREVFLKRTEYFNFWISAIEDSDVITAFCSILPCTENPVKRNAIGELSIYASMKFSKGTNASNLIQFVLEEIKGSPIRHLIAFSREDNMKAINLLEKAGFKVNEPLHFENYSKLYLSMRV